ncbi:carotenoid biosynthesis protein [Aquibacillus koreensis]|uniref:Carotenoid biosynthesis protein n=1 Tax=Aquibacillus koreensis TaxID=279446 RepID=A0A9X4AJQ3_9BACI|nr:carotenoid biosynthesis protein [Aquibacillus koreensis]MCT2536139.1 carotenoid biosynthesis protein [Aquibacillus koreensis]MDC3422064.1 carotenoid biosynthesis protein [Aquibacillus koreensis]
MRQSLKIYPAFVVWYSIGLLLMLFWYVPSWLAFSNSIFLILYAVCALELFIYASDKGTKNLIILKGAVSIAINTFLIEVIGVATGFPFGAYQYQPTLGFLVFGVPFTITVAWLGVIVNSIMISNQKTKVWRAMEVGAWVVLLDLILDPVAERMHFWDWYGNGLYYDIPLTNFISWFVIGAVVSLFMPLFRISQKVRQLATRLYQLMLLMFGLLGLKEGLLMVFVLSVCFIFICEGRYRYDNSAKEQTV